MTESQLYERIGRQQVSLELLNAEYDRLLAVLGQVATGEVTADRIAVDLAGRTWAIAAKAEG